MNNRHKVVWFAHTTVAFLIEAWLLAMHLFDKEPGFYSEISDRLKELDVELKRWESGMTREQQRRSCIVTHSISEKIDLE